MQARLNLERQHHAGLTVFQRLGSLPNHDFSAGKLIEQDRVMPPWNCATERCTTGGRAAKPCASGACTSASATGCTIHNRGAVCLWGNGQCRRAIVSVQNLGKQIHTTQRTHAVKPATAYLRCERHKTSEHKNARPALVFPASNATHALVCEAKWSEPIKSSNQQIAVKTTK